jgi:hypothetical protein
LKFKRREFITLVGGVVAVGRSPLPRYAVMLPPGRFRQTTRPRAIGSPIDDEDDGVVVVAALATSAGHCSEKHRPETPDCLESEPEHEPPVRSGKAVAHFRLRMAVALRGLQDALRKL